MRALRYAKKILSGVTCEKEGPKHQAFLAVGHEASVRKRADVTAAAPISSTKMRLLCRVTCVVSSRTLWSSPAVLRIETTA